MTKRDQLVCVFRTLDCGNSRHAQYIAFFCTAFEDCGERCRFHRNPAAGNRDAVRFLFGRYVYHVRCAGGVEMGQFAQGAILSGLTISEAMQKELDAAQGIITS